MMRFIGTSVIRDPVRASDYYHLPQPVIHAIMARLFLSALLVMPVCFFTIVAAKFQSSSSTSFVDKVELPVVASRFDRSSISMNIAEDVVTFGPYIVKTRIGIITKHDPLFLEHCDGILGLGWEPNSTDPSSALIQTLILGNKMEWNIPQPDGFSFIRPRRFALLATHDSGELQMGGYDPEAVLQPPFMMPVSPGFGYGIILTDLSLCGMSLLPAKVQFIGILDSGDSCIGLPSEKLGCAAVSFPQRLIVTFNAGTTTMRPSADMSQRASCAKRMVLSILRLMDTRFRCP